ncbi:MAG TPA: transketolase C-terminal domain-containing protein [Candidatus Saccharimonadales bacterium]|nr:transketolase C-terminal domain-containing protein [Candidatus Saccharimonadales bacterium]
MRDAIGPILVKLGGDRSDFFVVDADNGPATRIRPFGDTYTSRYVNVGCAEQNLLGVSAGLALTGVPVIASTFSVFLLGRAYDQLRNTVTASHLPVVLLGTHSGLSTGADGGSHCCPEDLALMRALPGMQILVPACDDDIEPMFTFALNFNGPTYIRVPRGSLWDSQPKKTPHLDLSKATLRCWQAGTDVALVTTGLMLPRVLAVAKTLSTNGISAAVYDIPFVDLDPSAAIETLRSFRSVVTVEDHWPAGGIGEMVAAILGGTPETTLNAVTAARRFPSSGQVEEVLDDMGLGLRDIERVALQSLGK